MADIAAIPSTLTGGPEGILRNYWNRRLLSILENELMAADLCDRQVIPANSGTAIEFHRIDAFHKQVTGVSQFLGYASFGDLKGRTFGVDSIVYSLELLTNDLIISEQAIMTAEPNPIPTLTDRFLYNVKDTLDQRAINIMVCNIGNTNTATPPSISYFGSSVSTSETWGDGSQTLTEATLDADNPSHRIAAETFNSAYTTLRSQSARPRRGGNSGRRSYDCLVSPEIAGDLRTDATFQDIALKGQQRGEDKFENAMLGDVFNVRVIEDENVSVNFPGTVDTSDQIVRCPVVGDGYCARISHARGRGTPSVNFIPPSKADKNDPHGLAGIMTWKIYQANGGVLNPLSGNIIKVATTRAKSTVQEDDSLTWDV
jgi:N4-gp56 family major capsid protein